MRNSEEDSENLRKLIDKNHKNWTKVIAKYFLLFVICFSLAYLFLQYIRRGGYFFSQTAANRIDQA